MTDSFLEKLEQLDVPAFRRRLIAWGKSHFRPFPWRSTRDPYRILIAETLLHRTQAKQVEPVFSQLVQSYPDIPSLARASREELVAQLHSLGLHWRIELIEKMATRLREEFEGEIPGDRAALLSLPGVGPYIASAVRCFAFGHPDAIVDTNVMRVITRVLGLPFRDSLRRHKGFQALAQELVDPEDPRSYSFAILDLAAEICTPRDPACQRCPVKTFCSYYHASIRSAG